MDAEDILASINMQAGICLEELDNSGALGYASRMTRDTLSRNITALRRHLGKNQVEFAEMVEAGQPDVSKWESKGVIPGGTSLALLVELAGCRVQDFMERNWTPAVLENKKGAGFSLDDFASENNLAFVEEVDLAIGMGASFLDGEAESLGLVPFRKEWIRGMFAGPLSDLKVVRGSGDSMEPTIRDGDFILIDTSQKRLDDQDIIWAVAYGNLGMIRRLRQLPSGAVRMMPDNPVVPHDDAHDDELFILGKVVWIGRRMVSRRY